MASQVKIGSQFFENELRVYRDWEMAWWRENIQNSVDAGSTRIDISVMEAVDETSVCSVIDNGSGMTQETLDNVYFVLGETTKGVGTIGGFGKARILTCFAQHTYSLHTGNMLVFGIGAEYEISPQEKFHKGVHLSARVKSSASRMIETLALYLQSCQLSCDVYVNGVRWTSWTRKNRLARELSFGSIYTNKSADPCVLVRVNGTLMYARSTSGAQVVLEIDPTRSRQVLQASRDGLLGEYQNELDAFVSELNIDKMSALRPRRRKSTAFSGAGTFKSKRKAKPSLIPSTLPKIDAEKWAACAKELYPNMTEVQEQLTLSLLLKEPAINLFDVVIEDNTDNPAIRKVIEQYDPMNWDLNASPQRANINGEYRKGMGRLKLLLVWKAACDKIIEIMQETISYAPDEIAWGVGWYFSDDDAAGHLRRDGTSYLMLNPCDINGKMKYSLSDKVDLCRIITTAAHEVVHIMANYHDEVYANLLTTLMETVLDRKQEILNHMKAVKESALQQLEKAA